MMASSGPLRETSAISGRLLALLVLIVALAPTQGAEARRGPFFCDGSVSTAPHGGSVQGESVGLYGGGFPTGAMIFISLGDQDNIGFANVDSNGLFTTFVSVPAALAPGSYEWRFMAYFSGPSISVACDSSVPFDVLVPLIILPPGLITTTSTGLGTQPPPPTTVGVGQSKTSIGSGTDPPPTTTLGSGQPTTTAGADSQAATTTTTAASSAVPTTTTGESVAEDDSDAAAARFEASQATSDDIPSLVLALMGAVGAVVLLAAGWLITRRRS